MKVTVAITVFNEADTLEALLSSLESQTRQPDEVVIIDGGSGDGTAAILHGRKKNSTLRVVTAPGTNISQGRNRSVRASSYDILAVTDGGCRPTPSWLENLLAPFEDQTACDLVCGSYTIAPKNSLEDCIGRCTGTKQLRIQGQLVRPTARSMAFTRNVWQAVGGFPEGTDVLDDLGFVLAVIGAGYQMRSAPDAMVEWRPRSSYRAVRRQFYLYARDITRGGFTCRIYSRTLIWDALFSALLIWGVFSPGGAPWVILAVMLAAYLGRQAARGCFSSPGWRKIYRAPLILAIIHLGVMSGIAAGLLLRIRESRQD